MNVGDRVVIVPTPGGKVAVPVSALAVGDRVTVLPTRGGPIVIRPVSPSVGDKALTYPVRSSGRVCLAALSDDEVDVVKPPLNFNTARTGFETADLNWTLNTGNTGVRIVRRHDRYPIHINDGTIVHDGPGTSTEDTGLDWRLSYYYCAWGKSGSRYSNGYLMDRIEAWGSSVPSWLMSIVDYGDVWSPTSLTNCLGPDPSIDSITHLGVGGWMKAAFDPMSNFASHTKVTIYEATGVPFHLYSGDFNPNLYIYPNCCTWTPVPGQSETYEVGFIYPNILYIKNLRGGVGSGHIAGAYLAP